MLEYDPMRRDYDTRISLRSYRLNYTGRYEPMRGFEPLFLACYLTPSRGRRVITSDSDFRVISPLIILNIIHASTYPCLSLSGGSIQVPAGHLNNLQYDLLISSPVIFMCMAITPPRYRHWLLSQDDHIQTLSNPSCLSDVKPLGDGQLLSV